MKLMQRGTESVNIVIKDKYSGTKSNNIKIYGIHFKDPM